MKTKFILLGAGLLCLINTIYAQTPQILITPPTPKNILYAELGGNSGIYSINYERIFYQSKNNIFQFSARIGFGWYSVVYKNQASQWPIGFPNPTDKSGVTSYMAIPIEANFSFGKTHKFVMGAGITQFISNEPYQDSELRTDVQTIYRIGLAPSFSYRYEKPGKGFFFQAGITPLFIFNTDPTMSTLITGSKNYPLPMPKICIGYKF
jgi:hypothetical protein